MERKKLPEPFSLMPFLLYVKKEERNCKECPDYCLDPEGVHQTYCSKLREILPNEEVEKELSKICVWEDRKRDARKIKSEFNKLDKTLRIFQPHKNYD